MQALTHFFSWFAGFIWGPPVMILLVGTGLYLTFLLRGLQFRTLLKSLHLITYDEPGAPGDVSHFSALMTSLGQTVGTGNIVGVTMAIIQGGPGAVFWMWVSGLLGMSTKFAEAYFTIKYRVVGKYGMSGGPMYYLDRGLNMKWLAIAFAFFATIASLGIGNLTQSSSIVSNLKETFQFSPVLCSIALTICVGLVTMKGIHSIAAVSSVLVPIMLIFYVGATSLVLITKYQEIPRVIILIFQHAFTPHAAVGGFLGASVSAAMRHGLARGLFSNEAGLGSACIPAASAQTHDPINQSFVSMMQVFVDTIIICTMTAFVVLSTDKWTFSTIPSSTLVSYCFSETVGPMGRIVVTCSLFAFVFTTIVSWCYCGEKAIEYLCGPKLVKPYRIFFICVVPLGGLSHMEFLTAIELFKPDGLLWTFSESMNALMSVPNLIGLLLLSRVLRRELKEQGL